MLGVAFSVDTKTLFVAAILGSVACGGTTSADFRSNGSNDASVGAGGGAATGGSTGKAATGGARNSGGASTGGARASGGRAGAGGIDPSGGGSPESGGSGGSSGAQGSGGILSSGGNAETGGSPATGGSPSTGGSAGSGGQLETGGSPGSCNSTTCGQFFSCCGDSCVNMENDPHHCGSCEKTCPDSAPYCSAGQCGVPPCTPSPAGGLCAPNSLCCGAACCTAGQICCKVSHNFETIGCYDPAQTGGTCPRGCPLCVCASPDTPISTPNGERSIASLRAGDRVLSVDNGRVVDVPILEVHREPVQGHHVVRVELSNGSTLEISALHPTADGRTFADLRQGQALGGVRIEHVRVVPYTHSFTYDIRPASDSGTYFAGGVLIGSTLGGSALSSRDTNFSATSLPINERYGAAHETVMDP